MKRIPSSMVVLAGLLAAGPVLGANFPAPPAGFKLQYEQNFTGARPIGDFVFSDAKAWRISGEPGQMALELFGKSRYEPKDRSPFNIALVADKVFADFVLEVEVTSTVKPYNHQDICLFFGFEATNQFYYAHIAVRPDPHAHNVFIVNEAPRLAIAKEVSEGVTWGEGQWHKVRIVRKLDEGSIKVYFDDFSKPIMIAGDKTFTKGYIGFGSFDDLGKFRNLKIYSPAIETKKTDFFQKSAR